MSAKSLINMEDFKHNILDDLESIFYVVMFCALRWLPLESTRYQVCIWILDFFNRYHQTLCGDEGGTKKICYIAQKNLFSAEFKFRNAATHAFFKDGYAKLWTKQTDFDSLREAIPLTWTPDGLRELFETVRSAELPNDDKVDNDIENVYRSYPRAQLASEPSSLRFESGRDNEKRGIEETKEGQDQPNKRIKIDTSEGRLD